jgi:SagB-type dehydrogenase family enzyme
MGKLLWVTAPLVAGALYALARAARGKGLSARSLNVGSSLLLLAYVLVTAGLGIFWVANQQLPVFDLHYLFGYGTVLLVAVHLWFNLPTALRHLRRRQPPAGPASAPLRIGSWVAGGAALLGAFALGTRHGRTEVSVSWPQPSSSAVDRGPLDVVARYHELSSHSPSGVMGRAPSVEWGQPPPTKSYPDAPRVALPPPDASASSRSTSVAIAGLPVARSAVALDRRALGSILFHANGVTERRGGLLLRAAPSSGALFAGELYLAVREAEGLEPGLYHYEPVAHALERIAADGEALLALAGAPVRGPAAVVALTAVFRRTGHKYRDRAYRYITADAGHLLENLRLAAAEAGTAAWPMPAFDDGEVARALAVDATEEGALALVPLVPCLAAEACSGPAARTATGFRFAPAPEQAPSLGMTGLVHQATSLRAAATVPPETLPAAAATVALPPAELAAGALLATIAARRSVRDFASDPIGAAELGSLLRNATAPPLALSRAVRASVVAVRVDGVPAGAYRYLPAAHRLVRTRDGDLAKDARAAALAQDVIGDAAAVMVLTLDRAALADEGARGYRHGFLEAGMVGERWLLDAAARGLGACPVGAFYDEEAAALVGVDPAREWVVHFAAVGRRAR